MNTNNILFGLFFGIDIPETWNVQIVCHLPIHQRDAHFRKYSRSGTFLTGLKIMFTLVFYNIYILYVLS